MAEISNLQESWNGHSFPEVEGFIKKELTNSGKQVDLESQGNRFRVNLLDSNGKILSSSKYLSTTQQNAILLYYTNPVQYVKSTDDISTEFFYMVTDANGNDMFTPATATITIKLGTTVKGTLVKSLASNSTTKIDLNDYIIDGKYDITVQVITADGQFDQTIYGSITAIDLKLSSVFNPKQRFTIGTNLSIPFRLQSVSGNKTVEWRIDGGEYNDSNTFKFSSTDYSANITIPTGRFTSGTHSVQIRASYNNNGSIIYSNTICFLVVVVSSTSTERQFGFATRFDYPDGTIIESPHPIESYVGQYQQYVLDYYVYDSQNEEVNLYIGKNSNINIADTNVSNTALTYTTKLTEAGINTLYIYAGQQKVYEFNINVISSGVTVEEPANPEVVLNALNKSNLRDDKDTWTFNGKNYATFENFNWTSDGWQGDNLLIRGKANLTLNFQPLKSPTEYTPDQAISVIFKIKVDTVLDEDQAIISCLSSGYGIEITPQIARMITANKKEVSRQFASGYDYEIGFVSHSATDVDNPNMLYLYINGTIVGGVLRSQADTIYQATPANITINGEKANIYLYSIRYYKRALTASEMVDLYLLNINDANEFLTEFENNNVIDAGGAVTVSSIPDNIPYLILTGQDEASGIDIVHKAMNGSIQKPLPRYDIDEILFIDKQNPEKNFKILGGCIRLQGTTTLQYPIKNLRIYSKNAKKRKAQLWLGVDESGQGGTLSTTHKYQFKDGTNTPTGKPAAPVSCFVLKADCSDSSSTHNVGFATFIDDVFYKAGIKTPPQRYVSGNKYDIRIAIDGFPCYVFYRKTSSETPNFLGKFNMINDKGSSEVFGFSDIKGYNNKSDGFRDYDSFKLIRVDREDAYQFDGRYDKGTWESLLSYAKDQFERVYNAGASWNKVEYDEFGEFIDYDDANTELFDRYGFVFDDDSWAVFYDNNPILQEDGSYKGQWTCNDGSESDPSDVVHKHVNPTECWEFATNISNVSSDGGEEYEENETSSRVLFTTSEFNAIKDGVAEWTNDFDMRYPESDDLALEYQTQGRKPRYLKALCDWLAGIGDIRTAGAAANIKMQQFKQDIDKYFNLPNLFAYFNATQLAMGVDQMAKNMMLCFFYDPEVEETAEMGKMRAFFQFYDNDTILGLRNDGYLIYNWDLDFDSWDEQQNKPAYAGQQSVLWRNVLECFPNEIQASYQNLRKNFTLQTFLDTFTKQVADKYCERIVNMDMYNKYIEPALDDKDYLKSLHGPRTSHRTWLITNRVDLFDAKNFAGDYTETFIVLRGGKSQEDKQGILKIKSLRDWYYCISRDGTVYGYRKCLGGQTYISDPIGVDLTLSPTIYGMKYAESLDLSDFIWNISGGTFQGPFPYLQELILSNYEDDHTCNTTGSEVKIGTSMPLLKRFVACNQIAWGDFDVSNNFYLEELDLRGSSGITSISFPNSDLLKTLRLGSGLTSLTLTNKPNIELATIDGAANFNTNIIIKDVSNACSKMALQLLNKRYIGEHQALNTVELQLGYENNKLSIGQTNINDLIRLAQDETIANKIVSGYVIVDDETIYRYQYNLLKEAFPNLYIECVASPDEYRIASENAEISECGSTNIYPIGMALSTLRFELGKLDGDVFVRELDTPAYSGSVRIDGTYPLENRITIDNAGKFSCDIPHENAAWTLDVYVHAYPYYYTDEEKALDTYKNSQQHYVKVTVKAVPVTGVTITGIGQYISPNTIYKPTYMVTPSNNTKYTQGVPFWSSNDVYSIDGNTGQFTSPTQGRIVIQLRYSMFGKSDGDSVKSTSIEAILNSAIMDKTTNSDVFYAFRTGLANAREAGDFTAFDVYTTDILGSNGTIEHTETQQFTATELQAITAKAFTYILKELAKITNNYSFSFGNYLVNVKDLIIEDDTCRFGQGLNDFTMPIESIEYKVPNANLFKECTRVQTLELPQLRTINLNASGEVVNEMFKQCGNYVDNSIISLPLLNTIQMTSLDSSGVINEMFYGTNFSSFELPQLSNLVCGTNDLLTDRMFGGNQNLLSISLPNLTLYRVGANANFNMFENSANIQTIQIGNIGANANSTLTLESFNEMDNYLFSNLEHLKTFETKNLQQIPGIKTFYNDLVLCEQTHTLDWGNTKLQKITYGAKSFFYRCENLRKWILPSTISECAETPGANDAFLFGSYIQIIDIRKRTSSTSWGDLFKGKVTTNTDTAITNPVQLLFLHIETSNSPTVSSLGTGLVGNYPVFIGTENETNTFLSYNQIESIGSFRSLYDPASYNNLWLNYSNYITAINNGMDESLAYNIYPCLWERGVTKNRLFPYCMAKWMSRKVFMTSLDNDNSGIPWNTLNLEINVEINPNYNPEDPSTIIEYDLDDITGTMLHNHRFDTKYSDKPVITTYSTPTLMRILNQIGVLSRSDGQFPGYTIVFNEGSNEWTITNASGGAEQALEITRAQLTNSGLYNNETVRKILNEARKTKYSNGFTFDELQYFTGVTQISAGTESDLNGNIMNITSITLPQSCTSIQAYGLCNTKLTKINNIYPVVNLGSYALAKNTGMNNYDLYLNAVETTGTSENIFNGTTFNSLKFDQLATIGGSALLGLTTKTFINLAQINEFSSPLIGCDIQDFQMPNCSNVNTQIFADCSTLKKVNLGITGILDSSRLNSIFTSDNLETIEEYTFDNITSVDDGTFENNSIITQFNSASIESIGNNAFANCSISMNNSNEIYSETLTSLGNNVFSNNSSITKVTLSNCSTIGQTPFSGCSNVVELILGVENSISKDQLNTILTEDNINTIIKYGFPKITELGFEIFNNNQIVQEINVPNLTIIGERALRNCNSLNSIQFDNVNYINSQGLEGTNFNSEQLIMPELIHADSSAFSAMNSLTTITDSNFPKLTQIGNTCFYNCSYLNYVKLSNIVELPDYCFGICVRLKSLTRENLPQVTKINSNAFDRSGIKFIDLGHIGEVIELKENAFNGLASDCKIILRSNTASYNGNLGKSSDTDEFIKPMYVSDQYEIEYEDELDAYYNREMTYYPSYEQAERINDDKLIDSAVETTSIESNLYSASDGGDDKIYTYYYPYNAKDRELEYEITEGSEYFDILIQPDRSVLIVPNESANSQTGKIQITVKNTDLTSEVEFVIPKSHLTIEDSVVKKLLVESYDSDNDGRLRLNEIESVTSICSLSDERIKKIDLTKFSNLTTIPDNTFNYNYQMTECKLPSTVSNIGTAFVSCSDKLELTLNSEQPPSIQDLGLYPEAIYVPNIDNYLGFFKDYDYLIEDSVVDTLKTKDNYNLRFDDGSSIKI